MENNINWNASVEGGKQWVHIEPSANTSMEDVKITVDEGIIDEATIIFTQDGSGNVEKIKVVANTKRDDTYDYMLSLSSNNVEFKSGEESPVTIYVDSLYSKNSGELKKCPFELIDDHSTNFSVNLDGDEIIVFPYKDNLTDDDIIEYFTVKQITQGGGVPKSINLMVVQNPTVQESPDEPTPDYSYLQDDHYLKFRINISGGNFTPYNANVGGSDLDNSKMVTIEFDDSNGDVIGEIGGTELMWYNGRKKMPINEEYYTLLELESGYTVKDIKRIIFWVEESLGSRSEYAVVVNQGWATFYGNDIVYDELKGYTTSYNDMADLTQISIQTTSSNFIWLNGEDIRCVNINLL